MELYIEREFLDNFYIDYNAEPVQEIVKNIITGHCRKRVFIDFIGSDFEKLEKDNKYFALISNTLPPTPIESIKDHLLLNSKFKQTLVFMNEEKNWFNKAENKGALCFSFDNYKEKIKEIIDNLHFKIDLSENFTGWDFLQRFKSIIFNNIVVSDNYILSDKSNQKMEKNIIPILCYLINKKKEKISISIFTKEVNPIKPDDEHKKEKANKRLTKLNSVFAQYRTKFSIIFTDYPFDFDFHDRHITTNFSLLECGKGFNLIPYKASNSRITSETIFDKDTYKRLGNITKYQNKYIRKIKKLDVKYKMYPE